MSETTKILSQSKIPKTFYLGLCILSFCLLALEILLTRILSVIFWYHFAFLVISVALFGMTVGAVIVYLAPKVFLSKLTQRHIAFFSYISSFAIIVCLLSLYFLPALFALLQISNWVMPLLYILLSLPFVTIGISLCLALTRFPEQIGRIYGINLLGSALGCIGIIVLLNNLNAASVLLVLAAIACLSAMFFSFQGQLSRSFKLFCLLTLVICTGISLKNNLSNSIRPKWVKGNIEVAPPFYDKWNFFSYISIGTPSRKPFGWGFSPKIDSITPKTDELMLLIDMGAGTVLTRFQDPSDLEYLKLDISAFAYFLRNNDDVLVLGSGGGRDLLTAVLFGAKNVVGVEINKDINDIVYNKFRDFTGNIMKYNQIQFIVDEGRSYVSRSAKKFNIIQASLVDSFAAFANGAFALTENSLYTTEAWVIFLKHLKDEGILTFSRWYSEENPMEIYRIAALASSSLRKIGIKDPRQHIVLLRSMNYLNNLGVGTILVSRAAFSDPDLAKIGRLCDDMGFQLVLSPKVSVDGNFISIVENTSPDYNLKSFPADISATSDDRPFFFYHAKLKDIFSKNSIHQGAVTLRQLFLFILGFGTIFILIPLFFKPSSRGLNPVSVNMLIYFMAIGLGFMLLEIPLMQRLGIFLGHPIYGLTVVLFSLLFSCGIGSQLTKYANSRLKTILPFVALVFIILTCKFLLPWILSSMTPNLMPVKISMAVLVLFLIGFFMGMPFPIGMTYAGSGDAPRVLYWGVNGFASVCGSALAAVIFINFGFQKSLMASLICYLIALVSLLPNLITSKLK